MLLRENFGGSPIAAFDAFAATGQTRSVVRRDYALIAPDSHIPTPLPSWNGAVGVTILSPAMGARLAQTLVPLQAGTWAHYSPAQGVEAVLFLLDGAADWDGETVETGAFLYLPPGAKLSVSARENCRMLCFEKRFVPHAELETPARLLGHESDVEGAPYVGDPDARLKVLLPDRPEFDLAVNIFSYQPGARLPLVEVHVMEHGLMMLSGEGIYRLGDDWYPVMAGDCIWMASYCPQWFAATGKVPARYIYYKDVNRDALG